MRAPFLFLLFSSFLFADSDREWGDKDSDRSFVGKLIEKDVEKPSVKIVRSFGVGKASRTYNLDPRNLSDECRQYIHRWVNYEDRVKLYARRSPDNGLMYLYIQAKRSAEEYYFEFIEKIGMPANRFDITPDEDENDFLKKNLLSRFPKTFRIKVYTNNGDCVKTLDWSDIQR